MIVKTRLLAVVLGATLLGGSTACETPEQLKNNDRWATTENTNVAIDWDKINEAYKQASGPEDFERRVNEIYEGDEVISVAVRDEGDRSQLVTGFFDRNKDGKADEPEKIFTIKREITGEGAGQYQTVGYGAYYGYHSPFFSIVSGMMVGSMLSSMFMPSYAPVAYVTSPSRVDTLRTSRSTFRAANPARFNKASRSGRSYGGGTGGSTPRSRGGRSFGLRRAGRAERPPRLAA